MKRKILSIIIGVLMGFGIAPFTASAITCTNSYPTTLNNYASGSCIPSAWANALEAKLGVNQSASTTSLDYQLNSLFTSYASEIVKATSTQGLLQTLNNLSDLLSTSTARQNLGANATYLKIASSGTDIVSTSTFRASLGLLSASLQNVSTFLQTGNNGSDINNTSTFRTNLGLGNLSTQNAPSAGVVVSNGSVVSSLSPTDSQILSASGTTPVYKTLIGGTNTTIVNSPTSTTINVVTAAAAAGSSTYVQYNDSGNFAATSSFTYNSSTNAVGLPNIIGTKLLVVSSTIAVSATSSGTNGTTGPISYSQFVSGVNPLAVVAVSDDTSNNNNVTGLTFNGVSMILATTTSVGSTQRDFLYYLTGVPLGTSTVTLSFTGGDSMVVWSAVYNGVSQGTPIQAIATAINGSSNALAATVSSTIGGWVVGMADNQGGTWSGGANTTIRSTFNIGRIIVDTGQAATSTNTQLAVSNTLSTVVSLLIASINQATSTWNITKAASTYMYFPSSSAAIFQSPNGSCYTFTLANGGSVATSTIPNCPN